jgi:hypothetical protein
LRGVNQSIVAVSLFLLCFLTPSVTLGSIEDSRAIDPTVPQESQLAKSPATEPMEGVSAKEDRGTIFWLWNLAPMYVKFPLLALFFVWVVHALLQIVADFVHRYWRNKDPSAIRRDIFRNCVQELQDCQKLLDVVGLQDKSAIGGCKKRRELLEQALLVTETLDFNPSNLGTLTELLNAANPSPMDQNQREQNEPSAVPKTIILRIESCLKRMQYSFDEECTSETNQHSVQPSVANSTDQAPTDQAPTSSPSTGWFNVRSRRDNVEDAKIEKSVREVLRHSLKICSPDNGDLQQWHLISQIASNTASNYALDSTRRDVVAKNAFWKLSDYNPIYRIFAFLALTFFAAAWFLKYVFDTDGPLVAYREYWYLKPSRKPNDMRRLLHLAWHCSVYIPILAISIVAGVVFDAGREAIFFLCLASSAVSLEICVSVILDKVHHLQDLSRQTTRAIKMSTGTDGDARTAILWIKYFQGRHLEERTGVAKAALVTIFSVFLFSIVLGIEVLTLWKHAIESGDHESQQAMSLLDWLKDLSNNGRLVLLAGLCSFLLFFIAISKLWVQTRYVLEDKDAMDRFASPLEAENHHLASARRRTKTDVLSDDA